MNLPSVFQIFQSGKSGLLKGLFAYFNKDFIKRSIVAIDEAQTSLFRELKIFTDVLAIVKRDYVREVPDDKLVEGAIKGLLTTLDPHSGYLDPDFYQDLQVQTKGEFGGLGIEITVKDGLLVVISPMEGSPAEKAGMKPNDAIVKIDGKFTKDFSLVDAVKKLRGPKGTEIVLSVFRKGTPELIEVKLIRDQITVRSVRARLLPDGYAYVRINQFAEKTAEDLKSALHDLLKASGRDTLAGLIIDLRNNPGGLLTQAILVSDLFLREGVIVYTDSRVDGQRQKYFAHERGTEPDFPLVVLVNGGSASASEIVAGALKDAGRGLIVGTQTFGKGSVQTISPLDNGGAVTLTTALYFTRSGNSLQAKGVSPDIEVLDAEAEKLSKQEDRRTRIPQVRESDLPGAIENPSHLLPAEQVKDPMREMNKVPVEGSELGPLNPETVDVSVWLEKDTQFKKAFEVIKTFNVTKTLAAKQIDTAVVNPPLVVN
jgi:carboxyl-terminal processing protease